MKAICNIIMMVVLGLMIGVNSAAAQSTSEKPITGRTGATKIETEKSRIECLERAQKQLELELRETKVRLEQLRANLTQACIRGRGTRD
jgi:hypothetical protein